ncbi:MAG: lamin tail domain-containing protein, partial [Planctomycetota bacterium]
MAGCSFEDNLCDIIGIHNITLIEEETEDIGTNSITGTVGNTTVFGEYYAPTERRAVPFRMPEDGIIQNITIFHEEGSTGDMILAVYDDDGDVPGSMIAVTPQTAANQTAGWQTIDLITPVYAESQARIWLAWIYEDMPGVRTAPSDSGWGRAKTVPPKYWDDIPRMPEEFGSCDVSANWTYSIYATYIPSGAMLDEDPPTPNPSEWAWPPSAVSHASITMTAATATDPSGVQYYFDETSGNPGGSDSDWQESTTYTDYGLSPETQYTYRVKSRDQSGVHNMGDFSNPASAATLEFSTTSPKALVINEFMASNSDTIADPQNEYNDWIEIYNASDITIDMGGMWLENSSNRWQLPNDRTDETTIGPHAYLLIWADNDIGDSPGLHAGFKLDKDGDRIRLYAADGTTLIDSIVFGDQSRDISYGRYPEAYDDWFYMSEPTPGLPNAIGMAGAPYFSRPGGTFTASFDLGLTAESPIAEIYYTTDGSEPDNTKTFYTGPFSVVSTQWIRARVYESGRAAGPIVSKVYMRLDPDVADFESNLPIVLIDSFNLNIDNANRNFHPVTAVFIDTDEVTGRAAITDPADWAGYGGMHIRGASTAGYPKKQFRFETWDEYGRDKDVS